jgi:hypothetical protein
MELRHLWITILVGAAIGACSNEPVSQPPTGPTTTFKIPEPPFRISGQVLAHSPGGIGPAAGVHLRVEGRVPPDPAVTVDVVTDSNGRYEAAGFPAKAYVKVHATDDQYRMPCPPGVIGALQDNQILNLNVVPTAVLTTSGLPKSVPTNWPGVTGMVVESGTDGNHAAAAAAVDLFYARIDAANFVSSTLTDATGHYAMCVPPPGGNDQLFWVRATKPGFMTADESVVITIDVAVDLTLQR